MPEQQRRQRPAPKERVEETAEVLNISAQSVLRDWRLARSWIMREVLATR
jgi:hypothetical protein